MTITSPNVRATPEGYESALSHALALLEKDPEAALDQAEALVRLKKDPRTFRLAAAACRKLGLTKEAEGAELGAIQAALASPELREAAAAMADGEFTVAVATAEQFLRAQPDDLLAATIAAEAQMGLWKLDEAEKLLRSVLDRAPAFLRASMLLALCLRQQVRIREAIAVLTEVIGRKPDNAAAMVQLAQLYGEVGDNAEAATLYERLAALEPGRFDHCVHLAQYLRILGRQEQAVAAFRRSFAASPDNGSAWWSLANYFPGAVGEHGKKRIHHALEEAAGQRDEGYLHLAAGLLDDRAANWDAAFEHFVAGKKILRVGQPYNPDAITAGVDKVVATLDGEFYRQRKHAGHDDPSPIFILGMPRSGTTLVERVLGGHSEIEGAGELQIVMRLAEIARHQADNPEAYAAMLETLSDDQLAWVGRRYVEASRDYRHSDKPRFIDKANLNWMQVGLILLALPEAKIIDVRRNGLDCCWANFKMLFNEGFPAANDLRDIGRFYRDYVRLLDAMKLAAPERILSVRYEDVVDDIEGQTQRMLDFLGLGFEPHCLDFHLSTGAVATASSEQVRQPLNCKGIGSAEPYRPWLGPLIEVLGPLDEMRS